MRALLYAIDEKNRGKRGGNGGVAHDYSEGNPSPGSLPTGTCLVPDLLR